MADLLIKKLYFILLKAILRAYKSSLEAKIVLAHLEPYVHRSAKLQKQYADNLALKLFNYLKV